jgi:hypothetical protein
MNDKKIILRLFHVFRRYCETAASEAKTVTKDEPKRSRLRELPGKISKFVIDCLTFTPDTQFHRNI